MTNIEEWLHDKLLEVGGILMGIPKLLLCCACCVSIYGWLEMGVFDNQAPDAVKVARVARMSISEFCGAQEVFM